MEMNLGYCSRNFRTSVLVIREVVEDDVYLAAAVGTG